MCLPRDLPLIQDLIVDTVVLVVGGLESRVDGDLLQYQGQDPLGGGQREVIRWEMFAEDPQGRLCVVPGTAKFPGTVLVNV